MDSAKHLVPGVDYPRTFREVDEWFRSDAECRKYIRRLRWPTGFICPRCGGTAEPWVTSRGLLHCPGCQGQTSLTAGTIFQDTRKPFRMWFMAMWYVTSQKNGVSALGLQRVLGLGSYEDGLDLAAQAAPGDGPPRAGWSLRDGGGGRDLMLVAWRRASAVGKPRPRPLSR